MADVQIRPAVATDITALLALETAAFPGDRLSRASFRRLVGSDTAALLVAEFDDALAGYALVLFREGSHVARLYSVAVATHARGRGLGDALLTAAERAAIARSRDRLRLEVRADNTPAIALYRKRGYAEIARVAAYYDDGTDAMRFERDLAPAAAPGHIRIPYFGQTTEFTCGPAALAMVLGAFGRATPSPELELQIWREANCVYLISAPGGCDPIGLGLAAWRRGLATSIWVSHPGPYFVHATRGAPAKAIMAQAQEAFRVEAEALDVPVHHRALTVAELATALDRGALAITLVNPWLLFRSTVPHWVLAWAHTDAGIAIHDPYHLGSPQHGPAPAHEARVVPYHDMAQMSVWGKSKLSATILLEAPTTP